MGITFGAGLTLGAGLALTSGPPLVTSVQYLVVAGGSGGEQNIT